MNDLTDDLNNVLPHEFLLAVVRGAGVRQKVVKQQFDDFGELIGVVSESITYPTFEQRLDAAHKVAAYYAPKLSAATNTQSVQISEPEQVSQYIKELLEALPN
jgi:hypothetical protein